VTPEPFSVYVHLPYCAKRCPYCDFNTYVVHSIPEQRYVETLLREAAFAAGQPAWAGRRVSTVFFGGGTPSLFAPESVGAILQAFDRLWGIEADPEITLEANPGSLEGGGEEKLRGFRAAGVTRVSFGSQSFNTKHLATLGRIHSAAETHDAFAAARRAGFERLSCDLIYGVPGQTLSEWREDLEIAVALGTSHVSAYGLTYEEGTPMTGLKKAGLVTAADEDTELAMFRLARELLPAAGLAQYEVSNYARPGSESRHNLAYWTWRDYLGLGAGAHGFHGVRSRAGETATFASFGRRYSNVRLPELYMSAGDGKWHASEESLTREMAMAEYLLVGLRLAAGVDAATFERTFGCTLAEAAPALESFIDGGLLARSDSVVTLTGRGLEIADGVISRLAAG
jgi:oxygen-independent coproporphyrinogen-3 oxidase